MAFTYEELKALGTDRANLLNDYIANVSYADLAQKYNIPVGTVKSRINRGRAILRSLVEVKEETNA